MEVPGNHRTGILELWFGDDTEGEIHELRCFLVCAA
jgi:hypothetical protein